MKNQYYGDNRDLFKYDLITKIMEQASFLHQFTFIPMLTPNDNRSDGNQRDLSKARAGFRNDALVKFLGPIHPLKKEDRDFTEIKSYFEEKDIKTTIYVYREGVFFSNKNRGDYFRDIPSDSLRDAFVFFDPDNGLEIKNNTEKHLRYNELGELYARAPGSDSMFMVIQFFPRVGREEYIKRRLSDLASISGEVSYITDGHIVLFFLARNKKTNGALKKILKGYISDYDDLKMGGSADRSL